MSKRNSITALDFAELLQRSDWVSSPTYAGWLEKKSTGFFFKNWTMKWVVLQGLELIYMDKEPNSENMSSLAVKRTKINSRTKIVNSEEHKSDPLCFGVQPDPDSPMIWQFRAESEEEASNWCIKIAQIQAIADWMDLHERVKVLGVGAQGTVYHICNRSTKQEMAMKEMSISNEKQMSMAISEAKLLQEITKHVAHPNLVVIEKVFQIAEKFYLVFPLCTGGELFEAVVSRGHFNEKGAAVILHDIISGLQALHEHNILHLDIKPENLIFETTAPDAKIKITDFGLSKIFTDAKVQQQNCPTAEELAAKTENFIACGNINSDHARGTFGYMAPELILTGYCSKASDVFAAGVVLYILLCGYPPFSSKSVRQLFVRTLRGSYKLTGPEWVSVTDEAKDLLKSMLDLNPHTRITTPEILLHPWITKAVTVVSPTLKPKAIEASTTKTTATSSSSSSAKEGEGAGSNSSSNSSSSNSNLNLALLGLKDHVRIVKAEKLTKTMTQLMFLKTTATPSKLAVVFLPRPASLGIPINFDEFMIKLFTSESQEFVHKSFMCAFGPDSLGRLPYANFIHCLMTTMILGKTIKFSSNDLNLVKVFNQFPCGGATPLLFASFADADHDGLISPEDYMTANILILSRNEMFLRRMFRVYQNFLPYSTRDADVAKSLQMISEGKRTSSFVLPIEVNSPPEYITAEHVAAVFEWYGYNPFNGRQVFDLLYDALERIAQQRGIDRSKKVCANTQVRRLTRKVMPLIPEFQESLKETERGDEESDDNDDDDDDDEEMTGRNADLDLNDMLSPNATLDDNDDEDIIIRESDIMLQTARSTSRSNSTINQFAMEFAMKELPDASESSRGQQDCQPSVRQMNVDDFLEAVALDEILVDVLVSAGHSIVFGLFMQLEECYNRSKQYYDVNPSPDAERLIFEQLVNETKKILHRA